MMKLTSAGSSALALRRSPLKAGFNVPSQDLGELLGTLGVKLFTRERTLAQHVAWSRDTGLLELLHQRGAVTSEEASASTPLTVQGADALLSLLTALRLVSRSPDGRYSLTQGSRDYLLPGSPFYVGDQLEALGLPIPGRYVKRRAGLASRLWLRFLSYLPKFRYGSAPRIENQHARNLSACVAAVRTGEFGHAQRIVDIAGGSGVFAIPLVLEYPQARVILTELPQSLRNIRPILAAHGVQDRVELRAQDVFQFPWDLPECDGIFLGNFLHGFSEEICLRVCREAFGRLPKGGTIWLHEMIWNETRDGPMLTALWHAAMLTAGDGGQRTGSAWSQILQKAGFTDTRVVPTASGFALIIASKAAETPR